MSKKALGWVIAGVLAVIGALTGTVITINVEKGKVDAHIVYSTEEKEAVVEDRGEINVDEIPTVEEVDGGMFQDIDTGLSLNEGEYADLGWAETYPVSSPEAFRDATLGKCIYANNVYGAQCVSLARVFWWSYADRDVSTCGTGMAKGMMKCAEQNAGDDFEIHWGSEGIQDGDWPIWETGMYGHVGMALGPVTNGYVALLGENQGGKACDKGGAAANIINLSVKGVIGYYRPKAYIKTPPVTPPEPSEGPSDSEDGTTYIVKKTDTIGAILRAHGYKGNKLFGNDGLAQKVAEQNKILNRGLIFPGQKIVIYTNLFAQYE